MVGLPVLNLRSNWLAGCFDAGWLADRFGVGWLAGSVQADQQVDLM